MIHNTAWSAYYNVGAAAEGAQLTAVFLTAINGDGFEAAHVFCIFLE